MRRLITGLLTVALLTIPFAAPVAANNDRCTKGDVQGMTKAGFQSAKLALSKGQIVGKGGNWNNCQFRLYDDNDVIPDTPEVPHVFTTDDWFLAGIFEFMWRDLLIEFGLSRADAIDYLSQIEWQFFWGRQGTGPLTEIELTHTNFRSAVNMDFVGWIVGHHRYHIFEAGSLDAGTYLWRAEFFDPEGFQVAPDVFGVVEIENP